MLYFLLNTHLHHIGIEPRGKSTRTQVLLDNIKSISSFTTFFYETTSLKDIDSHNVFKSSSIFRIISVLFNIVFLSPSTRKTIESIEIMR